MVCVGRVCLGQVLITFSDYGGKESWGLLPQGMKSMVPPSQALSQTGPRLPLQMLTGRPTFSLGVEYSASPSRTLSVSSQRDGKKQDFLLSMGAAGHSWELGAAFCSCWGQEAKECVCFPGFPGTQLSCHCSPWALPGPTLGLTVGTFYPIMKGIWNR